MTERKCQNCEHWQHNEWGCNKLKVCPSGVVTEWQRADCPQFKPSPDFYCRFFEERAEPRKPGEPLILEVREAEPEVIEWEYTFDSISKRRTENLWQTTLWLDEWGKKGWELVHMERTTRHGRWVLFKRRRRTAPDQGKCCECGDQESEGAVITEMWRPPEACCVDRLTLVVWHFENFRFLIKVIPETQQLMAHIEKLDELGDVEASIVGPLPPEIKLERSKCCERAGQESEGEQCSVDVHS